MLFNGTLIASSEIIGITPIYSVPDQYGMNFYLYYEVITKANRVKITSANFDTHDKPKQLIAWFESEYVHKYSIIAERFDEPISRKVKLLKESLESSNSLVDKASFD